ncbi:uncharacterized protein LOC135464900 isoform X2 [Liolophura sinensis]|uniref:uncharacterized protein LOC135464900 isoform X2 n=1 Tax=Liolophura sinensis TaxID=3198878 RepID=UPI003158F735
MSYPGILSQAWHQETQRTISRLAENSAVVANQLEESSQLQEKMLHQQNTSLQNQMQLINQASNLSLIIANSSSDVRFMFDEFNKTTQEQKLLIFDVFDRVAKLQSLVLGEFTGFYSIIFYTLSILISYMLTSTPRTSGARFALFGIMTLNIVVERLILSRNSAVTTDGSTVMEEMDESVVYCRQWWCRQISCVLGLILLGVCAYRYKDLNVINNQLLVEIRKQNSDLKKFILTGGTPQGANGSDVTDALDCVRGVTPVNHQPAIKLDTDHSTGYESDTGTSSDTGSDSDSGQSDRTYMLQDDADVDTSSVEDRYSTAPSRGSSRASTPSLMSEVNDLWNSTPVRELRQRHSLYSSMHGPGGDNRSPRKLGTSRQSRSRSSTPLRSDVRPGLQRYFLRDRTSSSSFTNPVVNTESPETFSKTVKRLARLASKNSMMAKFTVQRRNMPFGSSEDEL